MVMVGCKSKLEVESNKAMRCNGVSLAHRVVWLFCLVAPLVYAGPEPDDEYKSVIGGIALLGLLLGYAGAVGFLARSLGRGFWRWVMIQLLASSLGTAMFLRVLSLWMSHPDLSVLDLIIVDLVFDTWSMTNVLLFASGVMFCAPVIGLALLASFLRVKSTNRNPGKRAKTRGLDSGLRKSS
ncbi:hypothetical protein [Marinobacter similis]|uniref:Uncharacterized protein n=1 Tax=Marinobacter similis TaxID=1420916 RepID=W5YLV7_9GAMM|nr:hypothetical protein [Marinobacter similis]AHI30025.1 hypothetical protein AU14_05565 [Marinobacter similis]